MGGGTGAAGAAAGTRRDEDASRTAGRFAVVAQRSVQTCANLKLEAGCEVLPRGLGRNPKFRLFRVATQSARQTSNRVRFCSSCAPPLNFHETVRGVLGRPSMMKVSISSLTLRSPDGRQPASYRVEGEGRADGPPGTSKFSAPDTHKLGPSSPSPPFAVTA